MHPILEVMLIIPSFRYSLVNFFNPFGFRVLEIATCAHWKLMLIKNIELLTADLSKDFRVALCETIFVSSMHTFIEFMFYKIQLFEFY